MSVGDQETHLVLGLKTPESSFDSRGVRGTRDAAITISKWRGRNGSAPWRSGRRAAKRSGILPGAGSGILEFHPLEGAAQAAARGRRRIHRSGANA